MVNGLIASMPWRRGDASATGARPAKPAISVNLGLGRGRRSLEKPKIAPLVGLGDVVLEQCAKAALILRCRPTPRRTAPREFVLAYFEIQSARGHVQLDQVSAPDQRKRPAHERFGRDVQNTASVAGSA